MSTESIATSTSPPASTAARCASCGAPLAPDQRYCLECGERHVAMSSLLFGEPPSPAGSGSATAPASAPPAPPASPPGFAPAGAGAQRNNTLTVIAGVGVLLLAMGVGVLIGRAGASKQGTTAAPVITVSSPSSGATSGPSEATFTGDWPSGTSGYTVQLQSLPQSGTSASAVEAAKSSATAKGAKAVGALSSEQFSSLTAGSYIVYSGVYHSRAEAEKALGALKKSFPGATVIRVASGETAAARGAGSSSGSHGSSSNTPGANESHPAPPSVLKNLKGTKGKSYVEKSKDLPDVVGT